MILRVLSAYCLVHSLGGHRPWSELVLSERKEVQHGQPFYQLAAGSRQLAASSRGTEYETPVHHTKEARSQNAEGVEGNKYI